MARKRRGRPKKSKQLTYDSKETKVLVGIVLFCASILGLFSYFVPESDNFFGMFKLLFGDGTFLFSLLLFSISLKLFSSEFALTTNRSLLSQFFLTLFFAIFIAASADPVGIRELSYQGNYGGVFGYEVARYSLESFFLNFTAPIALGVCILLLPSVFNQSIAEFFGNIISKIKQLLVTIFARPALSEAEQNLEQREQENNEAEATGALPAMFSDFRIGKKQARSGANVKEPTGNSSGDEGQNKSAPDFSIPMANAGGEAKSDTRQVGNDSGILELATGENVAPDSSEGLKFPDWKLPSTNLLDPIPPIQKQEEDVSSNSLIIEQTLKSFGIESKVVDVLVGPSVTQYALDIALGIKVSKISNLRNDLALALATSANSVRIEVPIPGTSYVGIEVPNSIRTPVFFREIVEDKAMMNSKINLPVSVGKGISGDSVVADIQRMPHLLIAGATGSGKSVLTVSFILSLLMRLTPDEVKFIMVDPKQVELSDFNGIPHLLTPVIVDMDEVLNALKAAVQEMEDRYTLFRESQVRNIEGYNEKVGYTALPYIVVVIDELADMMLTAGKVDIETNIVRLAQKARATGIHLILATQRPSVNVITGLIKANIPGRIGMSVTTGVDSRVIIDTQGAEALLGKGDMLFKEPDKSKSFRVQGVFVKQEEVQRVVGFIKDQVEGKTYYDPDFMQKGKGAEEDAADGLSLSGDDMFSDAVRIVVSAQKGSASLIQRKLSLGYNRAAKLVDEMEEMGIVGPPNGSKPREVLVSDAEGFLEQLKSVS